MSVKTIAPPTIPTSLWMLFNAARHPGILPVGATLDAQKALPIAANLIAAFQTDESGAAIQRQLNAAIEAFDWGAPQEADSVRAATLHAGFSVGLATAWLLMQKEGAR